MLPCYSENGRAALAPRQDMHTTQHVSDHGAWAHTPPNKQQHPLQNVIYIFMFHAFHCCFLAAVNGRLAIYGEDEAVGLGGMADEKH